VAARSRKTLKKFKFLGCVEKRPLTGSFQNSVPKGLIETPNDLLCSNFVKFGQQEIGEIVRCLPDKKQQNFTWLSISR